MGSTVQQNKIVAGFDIKNCIEQLEIQYVMKQGTVNHVRLKSSGAS